MGAALLLQTLAAPLGAALLSWRWPRLGYLWGALALWLVGCLLGGAYGLPVKAWQWLPLTLLVPALAAQLACSSGSRGISAGAMPPGRCRRRTSGPPWPPRWR
ncbi:hypothetical protein ACSZN6_18220, partial [Aeromonas hydrophila]